MGEHNGPLASIECIYRWLNTCDGRWRQKERRQLIILRTKWVCQCCMFVSLQRLRIRPLNDDAPTTETKLLSMSPCVVSHRFI